MECTIYKTVKNIGIAEKQLEQVVLFVLDSLKKKRAAVSIHCVGDRQIRRLNREYRGKDKVTDVLSFAMQEGDHMMHREKELVDWGDIFICIPQIKRQAKTYGVSFKEELYRMTIHGVLHLLGYDHEKDEDARRMFPLQDRLLAQRMK